MTTLDLKGLHAVLSVEDGEWCAHLFEVPTISAYGDSPVGALQGLERAMQMAADSGYQWPTPATRVQQN